MRAFFEEQNMSWYWPLLTIILALIGGLIGWEIGGHPAAFCLTIAGALIVISIRDMYKHKHAVLTGSLLAGVAGGYFWQWEGFVICTLLAFSFLVSINDFLIRKNAVIPVIATISAIAWYIAFTLSTPVIALIVTLITSITLIGINDYWFQHKHAIRRNFPLLGWCRYGFELIGDELRQYWFMSDTEERPYDRDRRRYIYRSAKGVNNNLGFGTSKRYRDVGEVHLLHTMFPTSDEEGKLNRIPPLIIGKKRRNPYHCTWPINISGMSWGSLSAEAVMALSSGAKLADIHMITGEGGLTPYHLDGVQIEVLPEQAISDFFQMLFHVLSFGVVKKPRKVVEKTVGGAKILLQLGPAKFGFRKIVEDIPKTTEEREFRKHFSNELDYDKLKEVASEDQIVGVEIKLQQGGKPGMGGKLPKEKITPEIAKWRGIPMDHDCYSPNAWNEFHDVPSLIDFIRTIQELIEKPVGIKIAVGQEKYLREIAAYMKESGDGPDFITIDGGEGGTGAAPIALADTMGLPILHAIPRVDNVFREFGIRDDVVLIASGQIATGSDVAIAIALGADAVNIGRGNLLAEGCIQAKKCHTNHCPVGITTQDPRYRRGFAAQEKYIRVANYNRVLQRELLLILRSVGVDTPWDLNRNHVSVVSSPMEEKLMVELYPYPDGSDGRRNPRLGALPPFDPDQTDTLGPRPIKVTSS